jgi:archaellum component FlaC
LKISSKNNKRQVQDKNKMSGYSAPLQMPSDIKRVVISVIKTIKEMPNELKETAIELVNNYDNLSNDIRVMFFKKILEPIVDDIEKYLNDVDEIEKNILNELNKIIK